MEWLSCIKESIAYMENHLLEIQSTEEVANHVHVSEMYLQRGFQIVTGYTLGEYIRNRRLYLAAVDLSSGEPSVTETALKYGYDTPAGFQKAFQRFHGVSPNEVKQSRGSIQSFLRLTISLTVQGGSSMQFKMEKKNGFQVVGFQRVFDGETAYTEIPKFWDEMIQKACPHLIQGQPPQGALEEYVKAHRIGQYGLCIDDLNEKGRFRYLIAGDWDGGTIPQDMVTVSVPARDWAVFDCVMSTLQKTNTQIWCEWLPGNSEYEPAGPISIEWYSPEGEPGPSQPCQIWIPVQKR